MAKLFLETLVLDKENEFRKKVRHKMYKTQSVSSYHQEDK